MPCLSSIIVEEHVPIFNYEMIIKKAFFDVFYHVLLNFEGLLFDQIKVYCTPRHSLTCQESAFHFQKISFSQRWCHSASSGKSYPISFYDLMQKVPKKVQLLQLLMLFSLATFIIYAMNADKIKILWAEMWGNEAWGDKQQNESTVGQTVQ